MYPPSGELEGFKKGFKRIRPKWGRRKAYKTLRIFIFLNPQKIIEIRFPINKNHQDHVPFDFSKIQVGTRPLKEVQFGPPKFRKRRIKAPNIGTRRAKIAALKNDLKNICFRGCARMGGGVKMSRGG